MFSGCGSRADRFRHNCHLKQNMSLVLTLSSAFINTKVCCLEFDLKKSVDGFFLKEKQEVKTKVRIHK